MSKTHILDGDEALCGTDPGFTALMENRQHGCKRCLRALSDLLHAVHALSCLPGTSELCARDKRVARILERLIVGQDTVVLNRFGEALPVVARCEECTACQEWLLDPDTAPRCSRRRR